MGSCLSVESGSPLPGSPCSPAFSFNKRKNSKKRLGSQNSSFDYRRGGTLHSIPGRMFSNGSSEVASLFTQRGKKGLNQDAMIVWENFGSRADTTFCGVFDGHGPNGHMVAKRVRDLLPLKLSAYWEANAPREDVLKEINTNTTGSMNSEEASFISMDGESRVSIDFEQTEKHPAIFRFLKESFHNAFKIMDKELKMHANIECFSSGTTAVALVKQGQHLVIGNVGDSRAVLGTRDDDNALVAVQLTVDLKPNLPAEAERIKRCRGRVFALQAEPEVARVWLPNRDSPGLAMARALGDFCLKDFGLIAVPDISYRRLTDKDAFIVLATDGIWDVLSNEEVVEIVASAPARSSAARALVESAVRAWRYLYPTSKVDDCAVVCFFLDSNPESLCTASISNPKEQKSPIDQVEPDTKNDSSVSDPSNLDRSGTVRTGDKSIQDNLVSEPGTVCSSLEGVARVDSLLNLPRFMPGNEQKVVGGTDGPK